MAILRWNFGKMGLYIIFGGLVWWKDSENIFCSKCSALRWLGWEGRKIPWHSWQLWQERALVRQATGSMPRQKRGAVGAGKWLKTQVLRPPWSMCFINWLFYGEGFVSFSHLWMSKFFFLIQGLALYFPKNGTLQHFVMPPWHLSVIFICHDLNSGLEI